MDMQQTINPGATVYGADGEKVGTVATYGGSYVVVEKGFFLPKDYYIPVSAITETTGDAVYLSVTKDEALNQGWDQQPAEGSLRVSRSTLVTSTPPRRRGRSLCRRGDPHGAGARGASASLHAPMRAR